MTQRVVADASAMAIISLGITLINKGDIVTGSTLLVIGVIVILLKYKSEDDINLLNTINTIEKYLGNQKKKNKKQ